MVIVKPRHLCTTNFIPISLQLLKELPRPSIITSSCWKSMVSGIMTSSIDRKKRLVQNVTGSFAQSIRNESEFRITTTYNLSNKYYKFRCWNHADKLWDVSTSMFSSILWSYSSRIDWASEQATFWTHLFFGSIPDTVTSLTVLFQQLDVIMEGVLLEIGGK